MSAIAFAAIFVACAVSGPALSNAAECGGAPYTARIVGPTTQPALLYPDRSYQNFGASGFTNICGINTVKPNGTTTAVKTQSCFPFQGNSSLWCSSTPTGSPSPLFAYARFTYNSTLISSEYPVNRDVLAVATGSKTDDRCDDCAYSWSLSPFTGGLSGIGDGKTYNIPFYGKSYGSFFVCTNGVVSFGAGVLSYATSSFPTANYPMIAPFWGDVDVRASQSGTIWIRFETAAANLLQYQTHIRRSFLGTPIFTPNLVIVVTYDSVGYYSLNSADQNTFQCVIATDGTQTYTMFNYGYKAQNWMSGSASTSFPQVGFDAGDHTNYYNGVGTRSPTMRDLWFLTTAVPSFPGRQCFRIDATITPLSTDATLASLTEQTNTFTIVNASNVFAVNVTASTTTVAFIGTARSTSAVVSINGAAAVLWQSSVPIVGLPFGASVYNITVTAANGVSVNTYQITVYRSTSPVFSFEIPLTGASFEYPILNDTADGYVSGAPFGWTATNPTAVGVTTSNSANGPLSPMASANVTGQDAGRQCMYFGNGSVSQQFTVYVAGVYVVTAAVKSTVNQFNVQIDSTNGAFVFGANAGAYWFPLRWPSTGIALAAGTHTLTFTNASPASVFVDVVRVTAAEVALNGASFEDPSLTAPKYSYVAPTGWTASYTNGTGPGSGASGVGCGVTLADSTFNSTTMPSSDLTGQDAGRQVLFLQKSGAVSQTFTVPYAGAYTVTMAAKARNYDGATAASMSVFVDGVNYGTFLFRAGKEWVLVAVPIGTTLSAGPHTLALSGVDLGSDTTVFVDVVRVVTSAYASLAGGSFESPVQPGGYAGYQYVTPGGWTVDPALSGMVGVTVADSAFVPLTMPDSSASGTADAGRQVLFLQRSGAVTQSFTVPITGTYAVTFAAKARPYGGVDGSLPTSLNAYVTDGDGTVITIQSAQTNFAVGAEWQSVFRSGFMDAGASYVLHLENIDTDDLDRTTFVDVVQIVRISS